MIAADDFIESDVLLGKNKIEVGLSDCFVPYIKFFFLLLWISEFLGKFKVRVLNVYGFWIKQAPVLFKGIAHSLNAANTLVRSNVSSFISLYCS